MIDSQLAGSNCDAAKNFSLDLFVSVVKLDPLIAYISRNIILLYKSSLSKNAWKFFFFFAFSFFYLLDISVLFFIS